MCGDQPAVPAVASIPLMLKPAAFWQLPVRGTDSGGPRNRSWRIGILYRTSSNESVNHAVAGYHHVVDEGGGGGRSDNVAAGTPSTA